LNPLKKLFKQTAIYGLATVLPRMLSFLLVPIYTSIMKPEIYGDITLIFSWFAILNVFLAYGMETAFFRFYKESENKERVIATSLLSIAISTGVFVCFGAFFKESLAHVFNINVSYMYYVLGILAMDALVIVPFALLRANGRPMRYAVIKILNVVINLGLNIFFLIVLPKLVVKNAGDMLFSNLYVANFEVPYILISNIIASGVTLLLMVGIYKRKSYQFDMVLWRKMIKYAMPVMIAGIAFTVNEVFDRYLLSELLPADIAKSEMGKYSACYKLALFMTLFATAFRMGIEPFFFSHSETEHPQKAYAQITNYFVVLGSIILLTVVVYADILKQFIVLNTTYWDAMPAVPIILLASFFLGIYHNLSVWYKITDHTKFGAYISMVGALLTILINFAFIQYFSYMASAVATLVAYGAMMLLSLYFGRIYYPIPYNFRKIGFYLGISILFSVVSFYIFDRNLWIGSSLLLIFLGVVYKLEVANLKRVFLK